MIRRALFVILLLLALFSRGRTHAKESARPSMAATSASTSANLPRFAYVDLFLDTHGESLAAYQLEFTVTAGRVSVVGIEGGESPAFARTPPYYDPAAIGNNRVILAAYTTDSALPRGKTRVARLHLMIESAEPRYAIKLVVAANAAGKAIFGTTTFTEGSTP